jgi:hypothetical protein
MEIVKISATKKIPTSNAYAIGNVVSESESAGTYWTFNTVATNQALGGTGIILGSTLVSQATNVTPRIALDLYSVAPTSAVNDHVASTGLVWADTANYIGTISYPALENVGAGTSHALATPSTYGGLPLPFNTVYGQTTIYGIMVTRDAWTPVANNSVTVALIVEKL